jgi:hypothetical protein
LVYDRRQMDFTIGDEAIIRHIHQSYT